jgi:hypothetical protein
MFWWGLVLCLLAIPFLGYALFRWLSLDPGIDREIAKENFQAQQYARGLRRNTPPNPPDILRK